MLDMESFKKQYDLLYKHFEQAKSEGLIRHITVSSHMQGNDLEKLVDTEAFSGILIGYNALNYRFRQAGIAAAYNKGMGITVMNPLGGGINSRKPRISLSN